MIHARRIGWKRTFAPAAKEGRLRGCCPGRPNDYGEDLTVRFSSVSLRQLAHHEVVESLLLHEGNDIVLPVVQLCIKRPEFAHEDEVRLLIHDAEDKNLGDVLNVHFDYAKVLDSEVGLDPRLDAAQFKAAKDDLERAGCTLRIIQSDLYKIDEMTIDLE